MKILPGNRYVHKTGPPKEMYLYVELKAREAQPKKERLPLNISLVIDRSGSMAGDKLDYVKKAVKFVVDNLTPKDHLSVVMYDHEVEILSPSRPVGDKQALRQLIDRIYHRGMTNLSGGMLEGFKQVKATQKDGYVNRVLLLTDGLANRGVVQPDQLQDIARKKFREQGIALSTFGVGAQFNEVLLTDLAEHGGANYYFIDSPEKIPEIFSRELEGLLAVVAQNVQLEITYPTERLQVRKVFGYPATQAPGQVRIPFNDLHSLEEKSILLALTPSATDQPLAFQATLKYDDVLEVMDTVEEVQATRVEPTADEETFRAGVVPEVRRNIALFLASDYYEQAVLASERRAVEKAKALANKAIGLLELESAANGLPADLQELYDRLKAFLQQLDQVESMSQHDRFMYHKLSRAQAYYSRKKREF